MSSPDATRVRGDRADSPDPHSTCLATVKFTDSGEVILRVRKESEHGKALSVRFEVTDTGIGIDAAQQSASSRASSRRRVHDAALRRHRPRWRSARSSSSAWAVRSASRARPQGTPSGSRSPSRRGLKPGGGAVSCRASGRAGPRRRRQQDQSSDSRTEPPVWGARSSSFRAPRRPARVAPRCRGGRLLSPCRPR